MKSKLAKRLSAVILSLAMCVGLLDTSALAATFNSATEITPVNGTGTDGSIVVTVYDQDPGSAAGTGGQESNLSNPVNGVGINALCIGSVVELTSTNNGVVSTQVAFGLTETYVTLLGLHGNNAIARQDNTYYFAPTAVQTALGSASQNTIEDYLDTTANGVIKKVTGDVNDGVATFDGLDYGLYLLAKSALPADATTDLLPFLVSVPMYVEGEGWNTTVYAYPKVRTGDVTISKTVDDQDNTTYENRDIHVNAGQTLKYTVTTTIPAAATGNGSAWTGSLKPNPTAEDLKSTSLDYYYNYADVDNNSVLTITLTAGGLSKINADMTDDQTLVVIYDATVAIDVTFSTLLTNKATATYQREGMNETADATTVANGQTNKVDLYTYGIDLTKTLSDTNDAVAEEKISFELYQDNPGQLGSKIPVTSATGGNSGYWVAASDTASATMYVDIQGKLNIYGLEPGTYFLKETTTMSGYTLLAEPIAIAIEDEDKDGTATATVNGTIAQVTKGVVYLSVENTKNEFGFTLPQTGGPGTLLATAIGLGLLCAGIILLVIYRKKGRKNT